MYNFCSARIAISEQIAVSVYRLLMFTLVILFIKFPHHLRRMKNCSKSINKIQLIVMKLFGLTWSGTTKNSSQREIETTSFSGVKHAVNIYVGMFWFNIVA